jgi:small subunit ribosomal protein S16
LAVTIRLRRMGAKKRPIYRFVAIDSRRAREGRFVDMLGHYNPIVTPAKVIIDEQKVFHWLKQGATPSDTVHTLFAQIGVNEKWELLKQGKDASGVEIKSIITERKKKSRKAKKAAVSEEAAAS